MNPEEGWDQAGGHSGNNLGSGSFFRSPGHSREGEADQTMRGSDARLRSFPFAWKWLGVVQGLVLGWGTVTHLGAGLEGLAEAK